MRTRSILFESSDRMLLVSMNSIFARARQSTYADGRLCWNCCSARVHESQRTYVRVRTSRKRRDGFADGQGTVTSAHVRTPVGESICEKRRSG